MKNPILRRIIRKTNDELTPLSNFSLPSVPHENEGNSSLSFHIFKEIVHKKNLKVSFPFMVISPFGYFKKIWVSLITLSLVYTAWIFPLRLAFEPDFSLQTQMVWADVDFSIDILFMLDLGVNSLSAFEDDDGNLVYKKMEILKKYLRFWFWIDLISCFPFTLLSIDNLFIVANQFTKLSKLPKLFRVIKLLKMFNVGSLVYTKSLKSLFEHEKKVNEFLKYLYNYLFLIHFCCCMMYYTVQYEDTEEMGETWVIKYSLANQSISYKYISAFYFVMTAMVTTGYGNITAVTQTEKIMMIVILFLGIFFYGRVMGTLIELWLEFQKDKAEFLDKVEFIADLSQTNNLNMPSKMKERILFNFQKSKFTRKANIFHKYVSQGFFVTVPLEYLADLSLHFFQKDIEKFKFFHDKPPVFVSSMLVALRAVYYARGEEIFNKGDPPNHLFFILDGAVETYFSNNKGTKMKSIYSEGTFFGEIEAISNSIRQETAFAQVESMIWRIETQTFKNLLEEYPEIKKQVLKDAEIKKRARNIIYEDVVFFPALTPMNYFRWRHEEKDDKLDLKQILYKELDCYNREFRSYGRKYFNENFTVVIKDEQARKFLEKKKKRMIKEDMVEVQEKEIEEEALAKLEERILERKKSFKMNDLLSFQRIRRSCEKIKEKFEVRRQMKERIRNLEDEVENILEDLGLLKNFLLRGDIRLS